MDKEKQDAGGIRSVQPGSTHREGTDGTEEQTGQLEKNGNAAPHPFPESNQAIERLASFPQLNPFPILETDSAGRVTYCNPAATSVLEQLGSGASPDNFLPSGMDEILDALRQGRKALFNREVKLKSRIFSESIYTVPELQSVRIYAFDITERVRAEEMLHEAHRELEDRIRQRTEELRVSNEILMAEQQKLFALLDELPAIVCLLAPDRTLRFTNRRFREQFGDPRGHQCFEVMADRSEPCETCHVLRVLESKISFEWQWTSPTGRIYHLYDYPFAGPEGSPMVLKLGIDITERTKIAEELRKSEEKYRMLVEGMGEGLGVTDANQVLTYVNSRICEMLGYARDEILGRPATDFVDESYRTLLEKQKSLRSRGENPSYEAVWVRKDGRKVTTIISPKPIYGPDGSFEGSFGIVSDITKRKRAEEALRESERQLRSLSAQLLQVQEAERARISRELHDELGQALTIMKLRLSAIRKRLRKDQRRLGKDCDDTLSYIDRIIEDVRRLSRDLSPRVLEDLGLAAALRRLVNEFAKRSGIEVSSRIDDINHLLAEDAEIIVYRIIQEALTNIGRHAEAERASLNIEQRDGGVFCMIEDDGKGFDFARATVPEGMGIVIMKERIRMLGGSLDLWSQPGRGTRISFLVPAGSQGTQR